MYDFQQNMVYNKGFFLKNNILQSLYQTHTSNFQDITFVLNRHYKTKITNKSRSYEANIFIMLEYCFLSNAFFYKTGAIPKYAKMDFPKNQLFNPFPTADATAADNF